MTLMRFKSLEKGYFCLTWPSIHFFAWTNVIAVEEEEVP